MIISTAILMIIAIYTTMIKAESKGVGKTIASSLATRVMQDIANKKISDIKIKMKANQSNIKETISGKDFVNDVPYYYYAEIYPVNGNYLKDTNLLQIDCTVSWDVEATSETTLKNVVNEKNSVKFSRLIMITDND